jgi:hypothetical protein
MLTESFGLADGARAPGVISEQLVKLGPENGIGHSLVEFLLQLEQCCEKRLRNESASEPVEMTARVR